jgi:hypothetical protein
MRCRQCWLGHRGKALQLLSPGGGPADVGGRRDAVEVVALDAELGSEMVRVPPPLEGVVHDGVGGGLAMLETVSGSVKTSLLAGDLFVEPSDGGHNLGFPPLLGVALPLCPHSSFFSSCMAVPPPGAAIGGPLGPFSCLASLGKVPDRPTGLGGLPEAAAGVEVRPGLPGLRQSSFGLAQGGSPIRQAEANDGIA